MNPKADRRFPNDLITLFINGDGLDSITETRTDPITGRETAKRYVYGSINGKAFQVACDEPVEVTPEIAELLLRLI